LPTWATPASILKPISAAVDAVVALPLAESVFDRADVDRPYVWPVCQELRSPVGVELQEQLEEVFDGTADVSRPLRSHLPFLNSAR
jgi:hypothetical protein